MADQMLRDYLAGPVMTELLASDDIKRGLPDVMPPELMKKSDTEVVGMEVMWDAFKGNRQTALQVHHLSPSKRVETPGVTRKFATAPGTKENFVLDADFLMAIKSNIPLYVQRARNLFVRRMRDFRSRIDNLQNALVASAFSQGNMNFDAAGNLLPTNSGAQISIDFGLSFGGANALTKTSNYPNLTPSVAVGDWSSATTDIPASLRALRDSYVFTSNYNPAVILYGRSIPSFFAANNEMQTFMSRQPEVNKQFQQTNEIPSGMLDYKWVPAHSAYFVDAGSTVRKWFADNQIVVIPDPSDEWYEFMECGTLIPNSIVAPGYSVEQLIGATTIARGYFSYSELSTDPLAAKVINGWYGMPVIKNPLLAWSITVS